ncbi:helix-turn-helix domain-containing GNAT family N-acetyltransferase [Ichthyenterobacterium magnum]|uniref:MarR family transcriptional regulator with acetyltransferase activity n=1 Tax=Ichthyenterobacterium magnum TaxID=1230530 RepID=A0A420DLV2_9FLAO|nr:helix-turn-helix domain-containing GNAT family N-acetyltransferase [Ichthyenterobacterium magnum]RKE95213.1 MarR family transcriptional regulator with acetyltransferase activity [Ichthyenterobacterium magnum]
MDALKGFGELGLGSRLKRMSDYMMKETQLVYDSFNIDFDPYLFPIFKIISTKNGVTTTQLQESLHISQPAITQAINKLSKKELVVFKTDKKDKRKKIVFLSTKGRNQESQMKPIWKAIDATVKEFSNGKANSLIEQLNNFELKLTEKRFSTTVIERAKKTTSNTIEIINYDNHFAKAFYDLNIEWLKTYFYVEPYDQEVLSKPETYIVDKGGYIFFAKDNKNILGTVALMPMKATGVFELTKMAVSPKERGRKIGQQLMQHCIDFAKANNIPKLILYSSKKLENAIYIYRKYGFIEIPVEPDCPYIRCDIKMELVI